MNRVIPHIGERMAQACDATAAIYEQIATSLSLTPFAAIPAQLARDWRAVGRIWREAAKRCVVSSGANASAACQGRAFEIAGSVTDAQLECLKAIISRALSTGASLRRARTQVERAIHLHQKH